MGPVERDGPSRVEEDHGGLDGRGGVQSRTGNGQWARGRGGRDTPPGVSLLLPRDPEGPELVSTGLLLALHCLDLLGRA